MKRLTLVFILIGILYSSVIFSQPVFVTSPAPIEVSGFSSLFNPAVTIAANYVNLGDLMVVFIVTEGGKGPISPATGWTLIQRVDDNGNKEASAFYKFATSSDVLGITYTFNLSSSGVWTLGLSVVTGADPINPINSFGGNHSNGTAGVILTANTITTTSANNLILATYGMNKGDGTFVLGGGSNLQKQYQILDPSNDKNAQMLGTFIQTTVGTTSNETVTYTGSPEKWVAMQIAIQPGSLVLLNSFRSIVNGNYNVAGTWERERSDGTWLNPSNIDPPIDATVLIRNGHTVTETASLENITGDITIAIGGELLVNTNLNLTIDGAGSFTNNGLLTFVDNAAFDGLIAGIGNVKMTRGFSRIGWMQMSWPLTSSSLASVADIVTTGFVINTAGPQFNQYNLFTWNASSSTWLPVTSSATTLTATPFDLYIRNLGANLSLTVPNAEFNQGSTFSQSYTWDNSNPLPNPPGNGVGWTTTITDGWNFWVNPYQAYINAASLSTDIGNNTSLDNDIYVWYGGQFYKSIAADDPTLSFVSPNQSFFVRSPNFSVTGNYTIPLSVRDFAPSSTPNYFKTNNWVELNLSGEGFSIETTINENTSAVNLFDDEFDAPYLFPIEGAPIFNSVSADSVSLSRNTFGNLEENSIYLSFFYKESHKNFEIAIDNTLIEDIDYIYLEDLYAKKVVNLKNGKYSFNSNTGAAAQRFKIHFSNASKKPSEFSVNQDFTVWQNNSKLNFKWKFINPNSKIEVFDLQGRQLINAQASEEIYLNRTGIYFVRITNLNGQSATSKIVVSQK